MSTRPSLTPLADLGRSSRQAPLHGLRAAGIAAADDDAEIGARLYKRVRIGRRVEVADGVFPWVSCIIAELFAATIGR